ncbi:hypothetical protein R3W88_007835 [Solanum pinnatisectum]|uniref:Uncharacterized protein n=1 Tax=Solanum pinnatisectum TaxID=50273 RepID=A0AAV9M8T6_9SOLN|nr:hypothetical protein R3W88_007835 [Solanum pinnatisectum]
MATLKPYTNEVKDTVIDVLKVNLKGVTILTSAVENEEDELLGDTNSNQPCENYVSSGQKNIATTNFAKVDENFASPTVDEDFPAVDEDFAVYVDEILPLEIVDEDLVAVDEYFAFDEVEKEQEEENMAEKEEQKGEEKLEENEEEKEEEKLEEKKEEEKKRGEVGRK